MDLHLVDDHAINRRLEAQAHANAEFFGADQRQRARFLDQFAQALDPLLGLAMRHEIAQAADDLAGAQRLLDRRVDCGADETQILLGRVRKQPA